jgi:hypothetical protein
MHGHRIHRVNDVIIRSCLQERKVSMLHLLYNGRLICRHRSRKCKLYLLHMYESKTILGQDSKHNMLYNVLATQQTVSMKRYIYALPT